MQMQSHSRRVCIAQLSKQTPHDFASNDMTILSAAQHHQSNSLANNGHAPKPWKMKQGPRTSQQSSRQDPRRSYMHLECQKWRSPNLNMHTCLPLSSPTLTQHQGNTCTWLYCWNIYTSIKKVAHLSLRHHLTLHFDFDFHKMIKEYVATLALAQFEAMNIL